MTFFSSLGSLGTSSTRRSPRIASRFASSSFSSSSASSRISASAPRTISSDPSMSFWTTLYSRYFCTSGSRSESCLAALRYSAGSDCTSVVPRRAIRSSYCDSTVLSLSNIEPPSRLRPAHHPPDTGGRNATSSPSRTTAAIFAYSALTATDMVRSYCTSAGNSAVSAVHTVCTVAGASTSRTSSPAPARSLSRANSFTVTRIRTPLRSRARDPVRRQLCLLVVRVGDGAFQPDFAALEMLVLPDRHNLLHPLDRVPAGGEGVCPVRRCRDDDDAGFADLDTADPMVHGDAGIRPRLPRLGHDQLERAYRERLVRLVFEEPDLPPLVVISNQSGERCDRAV